MIIDDGLALWVRPFLFLSFDGQKYVSLYSPNVVASVIKLIAAMPNKIKRLTPKLSERRRFLLARIMMLIKVTIKHICSIMVMAER